MLRGCEGNCLDTWAIKKIATFLAQLPTATELYAHHYVQADNEWNQGLQAEAEQDEECDPFGYLEYGLDGDPEENKHQGLLDMGGNH